MAVSGYSIWHIHAEFPQYAAYKDLGQLGSLIIGRPWGQPIYISEFYGRSNILLYQPGFPGYPCNYTDFAFGTAHGTCWYGASSHEYRGNNTQLLNVYNTAANTPAAWAKLIRIEIPFMGYSWDKATWEANGYQISWGGGNFGGGAMNWYFYG